MDGVSPAAAAALAEIVTREDPGILGIVLSGSAARGRATLKSPAADEIAVTLAELESLGRLGTDDWWYRWSFAWAQVLRDDTHGRITEAVRRQAALEGAEQDGVLVDRLDGYINFVYRALKAERDGRSLERRLDSAESVTWWLDTVFALNGRVRPYNKYLPWELREHPLGVPEWSAEVLLPLREDRT